MQFKIRIVVDDKHGETITEEILTLDKSSEGEGLIGLSLSESKRVLKQLQKIIVNQQADRYTQAHRRCPSCRKKRRIKDSYVNEVVAKHMVKKQQMQWSRQGAHWVVISQPFGGFTHTVPLRIAPPPNRSLVVVFARP